MMAALRPDHQHRLPGGPEGRAGPGALRRREGRRHRVHQVLAREVGGTGVTANCIAPGPINTPLGGDLSEEWTRSLAKACR